MRLRAKVLCVVLCATVVLGGCDARDAAGELPAAPQAAASLSPSEPRRSPATPSVGTTTSSTVLLHSHGSLRHRRVRHRHALPR